MVVDKRYIYQLMFNVQLTGSVRFDSQIKFHTGTKKEDVSLAKGIKYHPEKDHRQNGDIDKWKKIINGNKNVNDNAYSTPLRHEV